MILLSYDPRTFLRGFFFHARRDLRVHIQRELCRGATGNFRGRLRIDAALDRQGLEADSALLTAFLSGLSVTFIAVQCPQYSLRIDADRKIIWMVYAISC